jgi:hypothetical protein
LFTVCKENAVFTKPFHRCAGLLALVALLADSAIVVAQENLPQGATYRGEIRRGADGKLTVMPEAEAAGQQGAANAAPGGTKMPVEDGVSGASRARLDVPARRLEAGPPDMSCLTGRATLSPSERALVKMPADSWISLPGTAFGAFCKARQVSALEANGGCAMAINAWSGGVFDEHRRKMLVIGGGHMDYWGNEVYGFDLASASWSLVKPASPLGAAGVPSEPMPDGNPVSRHTYDGLAFMRHLSQVFMFGGATAPNGYSVNSTWWFDPAKGVWRAKGNAPRSGAGHYYMASAYDPVTRKVYVREETAFLAYDPDADRWSGPIVNFGNPPYYPRMQTHHYRRAVIMPAPRVFLAAGGMLKNPEAPDVFIYDLDSQRDATGAYRMTGDTSVISVPGPGLDVDTRSGALVAWAGGAPAIMDPATWHWRRGSARGAPAQAVGNGTFGRFRYIPYLNAFILVNRPDDDVHFYKLTAGCGSREEAMPR